MPQNFNLGASERKRRDDSINLEQLPSNKLIYIAKVNNDDDASVEPVRCNNLKDVFEKFQPSFECEMESTEGENISAEFRIKGMKDFSPKALIENNDQLSTTYYSKEILANFDKELKKNAALKKTLSDKEKKEALLKAIDYYIDLLNE